jgi:hypothetical protein
MFISNLLKGLGEIRRGKNKSLLQRLYLSLKTIKEHNCYKEEYAEYSWRKAVNLHWGGKPFEMRYKC